MTILHIIEGSNAKLNLTMLISWLKHPKNIYNMSKIEVGVENQFKFEFKFKLELKQKRKGKKRKTERAQPTWAGPGQMAQLALHGPQGQSPLGQADEKQKHKKKEI